MDIVFHIHLLYREHSPIFPKRRDIHDKIRAKSRSFQLPVENTGCPNKLLFFTAQKLFHKYLFDVSCRSVVEQWILGNSFAIYNVLPFMTSLLFTPPCQQLAVNHILTISINCLKHLSDDTKSSVVCEKCEQKIHMTSCRVIFHRL